MRSHHRFGGGNGVGFRGRSRARFPIRAPKNEINAVARKLVAAFVDRGFGAELGRENDGRSRAVFEWFGTETGARGHDPVGRQQTRARSSRHEPVHKCMHPARPPGLRRAGA
ncbi:hypothetical protein FRUB_08516 [Fimbriiglobus ruber]|uniref:Uncharacterized protein n=1 Tax=Fimbriiglobus ruber TaxID=1908690 RepID=A0A225D4T3_9BACT|nr:hypothetical protein FRUB_08516 [Fimbriiglobus ruber]